MDAATGRFRKTATVDAWRWDPESPRLVLDVLDAAGAHYSRLVGGRLGIGTLESGEGLDLHAAKPGDWVLRGAAGEFYAHDADLFERNYEPVANTTPLRTTDDLSPNARRELDALARVTGPRQAEAILIAHQRRDVGSCLCGWAELGKSFAGHQVAELREAGLLVQTEADTTLSKEHDHGTDAEADLGARQRDHAPGGLRR